METYIWLIPALPLVAFLINFLLGKRGLRQQTHWVASLAVIASFVLSVLAFLEVMAGKHLDQTLYRWIDAGPFDVTIGFLVDPLTAIMLLVVTSVSSLVHIFSIGYMKGDGGYYRF